MDFVALLRRSGLAPPITTSSSTVDAFSDRGRVEQGLGQEGESSGTSSSIARGGAFVWMIWVTIASIVGLALSVFAVYLSWTCSTAQRQHTALKIILAVLAFMFSLTYIIVHYILVFVTRGTKRAFCAPEVPFFYR